MRRNPASPTGCALVLLLALTLARPAAAVDNTPPLANPVLQQRYLALTHELRCMQCQDEALADSPVTLAAEMRLEVHNLVAAGRSEQQVRDYMVSRYGEFILYRPPMNWRNAWLWGTPPVLMLVGGIVAWRVISARRRLVEQDDGELPDESLES